VLQRQARQSLLVTLVLVITYWPQRHQYSHNRSCLILHGSKGVVDTHLNLTSESRKASKESVWKANLSFLPS
jgi:hypothetical protein